MNDPYRTGYDNGSVLSRFHGIHRVLKGDPATEGIKKELKIIKKNRQVLVTVVNILDIKAPSL